MVNAARQLRPVPPRVAPHHHPAGLRAPFYAVHAETVCLHRYLDEQFVPAAIRDLHALAAGSLPPGQHFAWQASDRFGKVADVPCLRHPITGTYYLVSVEAVCTLAGEPALDPKRIRSAGFVIRRQLADGRRLRWMLAEGEQMGWAAEDPTAPDPDQNRRGGEPITPEPPYSGEQTYPLHPVVVQVAGRSRTILHGYLPVAGGSAKPKPTGAQPGGSVPEGQYADLHDALSYARPWPFGSPEVRTVQADGSITGRRAQSWNATHGRLIDRGRPSREFFRVLHDLVHRHRLGIHLGADNAALERAVDDWRLVRVRVTIGSNLQPRFNEETVAFLDWMKQELAPLRQEQGGTSPLHDLLRNDDLLDAGSLPMLPGLETTTSIADWRLNISQEQATALREALVTRDLLAIDRTVGAAPLPRFAYADDERLVVVPFVRWAGERCAHVAWGQPSQPFRVASPYDPEATRPVVIPLPSFKDLRRGILGAHFVAPKDLAEKLLGMKADKLDISKKPFSLPNLCFSFSFSIPAITICAMILLMIILHILQIIFFWLPFVFLRLPSFCLGLKVKAQTPGAP